MVTIVAPVGAQRSISFVHRHRRAAAFASALVTVAAVLALGTLTHTGAAAPAAAGVLGAAVTCLIRYAVPAAEAAPAATSASRDEQIEELRRLETVGQLAGGIAHDFNNILTVIGIHSEFLLAGLDASAPQRSDAIQIHEATGRASMLTKQLLAFSRRQVLEMSPVNVNDIVRDMTPMLGRLIGEDLDIQVSLTSDIGIVLADVGQMQQVIMNLVVNARDAMPGGGTVAIDTASVELDESYALEHAAVTPGDYVMLSVSDTGCGMSPDVRARIFEPFFTTKPAGLGTGLGLATVFGIVRQSGGYVWVYSEPGHGSSFKIYLPVASGFGCPAHDAEQPKGACGAETILLVEDEQSVRRATGRILQQHGYDVIEACNGSEALSIAQRTNRGITLLLTDVVMPKAHGPWLVKRITDLHPQTRVLYMSGYTDADIARRGMGKIAHTLQKPFSSKALLRAVRARLDGEHHRRNTSPVGVPVSR